MKALSLHQPWASLIAAGAKRVETRTWRTHHRGLLAIHAAQRRMDFQAIELLRTLGLSGLCEFPLGCIVATCRVVDCIPTDDYVPASEQERACGDFRPGRFAWILDDVKAVVPPIACKGSMGLWTTELV